MKHIYVVSANDLRNVLQDNSVQAITLIHDYNEEKKEAIMTVLGENESKVMKLKNPLILEGKKIG